MRQDRNIRGSVCEDYMATSFCLCCSVAQMATEVDAYQNGECSCGPPASVAVQYTNAVLSCNVFEFATANI